METSRSWGASRSTESGRSFHTPLGRTRTLGRRYGACRRAEQCRRQNQRTTFEYPLPHRKVLQQVILRAVVRNSDDGQRDVFRRQSPAGDRARLFRQHNEEFNRMVGISRSKATYYKYRCVCKHLANYIWDKYDRKDLMFKELNREFLTGFHAYIAKEAGYKKTRSGFT